MSARVLGEKEYKEHLFKRFWDKVLIGDGCWEWESSKDKTKYPSISTRIRGVWKAEIASRVSWYLSRGKRPKLFVLHKCDNPICVRPSHLFEGTQTENRRDCFAKGRDNQTGEQNTSAKLTEENVLKIRELGSGELSQRKIAKLFRISQATVWNILERNTWSHLKISEEKK